MAQYGINWRQLRDQPSNKGTLVYFNNTTGATAIGKVDKTLIAPSVKSQIAFEKQLDGTWGVDTGTVPGLIQFGLLNFNSFLGTVDTAIYTDIELPAAYEKTLPLKFGVFYRMQNGNSINPVELSFDYTFIKDATPAPTTYTNNAFTITPTIDTDIHVAINASIPAQPTATLRDLLSLRFARKATSVADTNTDAFLLLSTLIYQDAVI